MREEKLLQFINLRQTNMSVKEYDLKFTQLDKYASTMVVDPRARMMNKGILNSGKSFSVKVPLIPQLKISTKIGFLNLRLKEEMVVIDLLPLLALGVGRDGRQVQPIGSGLGAPKQNKLYALQIQQDHAVSSDVVIELDTLDFDVILGMDWLHACYVSIDCRTQLVTFKVPNEPSMLWEEGNYVLKDFETPTHELVPIVNEFLEVFLDDLSSVSSERKRDFSINLLPEMHSISIPPYRMSQ
ncbi:hypothetical protein MTR67_002867 [Solanum verrucosum]|uniref:Gag-pol polyprotein n=1 Tax=Solanum verrucosum TaxID=315347 RepID=A0AAF0PRU3_SOLVR|nr:hypothetical protein MTR67_002867 [Solanum verrucosum]